MKHNIFIIIIFFVLLSGAYFFCNTLFLAEQKSFDKARISDLEMNASAVSVITGFFINDLIACVKHASAKLSKNSKEPTEKDLEYIYNTFALIDLPIMNIGFLDEKGIVKNIYPSTFLETKGSSFADYKCFQQSKKLNKLTASKVVSYPQSKDYETNRNFFVLTLPVINKDGIRTGFITASVDMNSLTDLIQLTNYINAESHIKFYIIDPERDQILCSPDDIKGRISEARGRNSIRDFVMNASKITSKNSSKLIGKGKNKIYVTTSKVNVKDIPLVVVATDPYINTFNYSADATRRIAMIIVFVCIMLILLILLIVYQKTVVKKLKMQISSLEIIIDKDSVKKETEKIAQSDYFKELNDKIKTIRDK
jgi:hypothetical protein